MQMSEEEICRRYKENRKKKGYTNILAQLNDCTKQEINEILRKNGISLPGNPNFKSTDQSDICKSEYMKKSDVCEGVLNVTHKITSDSKSTAVIKSVSENKDIQVRMKIPKEVRDQLEDDVERIKEEIMDLGCKLQEINKFLSETE